MSFVITVDGPSGAGKGTLCLKLAEATGFELLDSGALYRLTALAASKRAIALDDIAALANAALNLHISFETQQNKVVVLLDGEDVSKDIRQEHIGMGASRVAAIPEVRAALLDRQRAFADGGKGLVADGRDMGTVVFPSAPVKLFLTASAEERARRRVAQLEVAGQAADYAKILQDIEERDKRDTERKDAPLRPAEDALLLDSTSMSIEQVFESAMAKVREIMG